MVFRYISFLLGFKYKQHIKTSRFLLKLSLFINIEKVPTVPNIALETLEIVSASKQKFYIRNQKELKLNKNPDSSTFR